MRTTAPAGSRAPLVVAPSFLAGITFVQYLAELPSVWWCLPAVALAVLGRHRRWMVAVAWCLFGVAWATLRAEWVLSQALPSHLEGRDLVAVGTIASLPERRAGYRSFDLDVAVLRAGSRTVASPGRVRLRAYGPNPDVRAGERWTLRVRLKRPHGFQNPGGFDYEAWLFRHRIRATGYVRETRSNRRLDTAPRFSLLAARAGLRDTLAEMVPAVHNHALVAALAVGDRSRMSVGQWEVLRRTGTSHLLAISGLHVGMVGAMAMLLGAGLWRCSARAALWVPAKVFGAGVGLIAAALYAGLAGFSIPTQRALIMLAVILVGVMLRRPSTTARVLALALFALLVHDPLAVLDIGFWLSFAAVAVIATALVGAGAQRPARRWRWVRLQWALSVALIPVLAAFFHQVSVIAPIANMIAIPMVGFLVVPMVLLGTGAAASGIDVPAIYLLGWATHLLDLLWWVLERLADTPVAVVRTPTPAFWALAAGLFGAVLALLPRGLPARRLAPIWLLPIFMVTPQRPEYGAFRATILDVGQGLAVVVSTQRQTVVYDTGARFGPDFDMGRAVLLPFLIAQGIPSVDTLVISHGDNDHIGGAKSLLSAMPVRTRLSSVAEEVPGAAYCVPRRSWRQDGVEFSILHPREERAPRHNDSSCVLRVRGRYGSLLLTGDIEVATEQRLLAGRSQELDADILLVPHQGSITSSSEVFLDAVSPALAVVSAGHLNPYGHPSAVVLERLRRRGIPVLNTASSGAIMVEVGPGGVRASEQRQRNARYWFSQ